MPKPKRTQNQNTDPHPFAFQQVRDPETGEYSWKRLVSPQIPDEILTTGNPGILQSFYETHKDTLTPADTKYMLARMHTAFKLERLERESQKLIRDGGEYPKPEVTTKKGYIGLDSIRLTRPQTSNCGCWSCGMSLLLGADMVLCTAVVTATLVGHTMKKPLATVLLLMIVFPLRLIPVMLLAAAAAKFIPTPKILTPKEITE